MYYTKSLQRGEEREIVSWKRLIIYIYTVSLKNSVGKDEQKAPLPFNN